MPGPSREISMLNPDFRDILYAFCEEGVEFLVVGAYALAVHGHPRATGDLDLWILPSEENADRVLRALERFGAPLLDLAMEDLQTPDTVFQIGVAPRRIDILTSIEGVDFDEAWAQRVEVEIEGLKIPVIGRSHLIQNKRAAGRPQDLADVARLEEHGGPSIR
jgi:hypothetical protein